MLDTGYLMLDTQKRVQMTEVFEFGIGNAEWGIEKGYLSDFYKLGA